MSDNKAQPMSKEQEEDEARMLLDANDLKYRTPASLSLMNQRNMVRYDSQASSYAAGQTMDISISNSSVFVNGKKSFLYLTLAVTGGTAPTFGVGSAANLIERVVLIDSSGTELCHNTSVNVYNVTKDYLTKPPAWFAAQGLLKGYGVGTDIADTFVIPMADICPIFSSDQLIPPFLLSGSRLRITFASIGMATSGTAVPTALAMSDCYVLLDSSVLADSSMNAMEKQSAEGKVQFSFENFETVQSTATAATLNVEVTKAVGRATQMFAHCVLKSKTTTDIEDAMQALNSADDDSSALVNYFQARINSMYFPALPSESYKQLYLAAVKGNPQPAYLYTDASVTAKVGQLIRQDLQRSEFLGAGSGLAINSSGSLRTTLKFSDSTNNKLVNIFIKYLSVLTPFLYSSVTVEL